MNMIFMFRNCEDIIILH